MELEFDRRYLSIKLNYINKQLESLPVMYRNRRKDKYCIKYFCKGKLHEIQSTSPRFENAEKEFFRIKRLKEIKRTIESVAGSYQSVRIKEISPVLGYEEYCRMESRTDNNDGNHPYNHKEFWMRSRFEVAMAGVLDSMELEYKYEPRLSLGNFQVEPDFVVYLPEFNCCMIIECEGMTEKIDYVTRNGVKFAQYLLNGFTFGMDMIVLHGDKTHMPSPELMRNAVVSAINLLTSYYVLS